LKPTLYAAAAGDVTEFEENGISLDIKYDFNMNLEVLISL